MKEIYFKIYNLKNKELIIWILSIASSLLLALFLFAILFVSMFKYSKIQNIGYTNNFPKYTDKAKIKKLERIINFYKARQ